MTLLEATRKRIAELWKVNNMNLFYYYLIYLLYLYQVSIIVIPGSKKTVSFWNGLRFLCSSNFY